MTTTQRKVARQLAKALVALDLADWYSQDWRDMSNHIRELRVPLSNLFTSTGYEFGAGNGSRIRKTKA